MAPKKNQPQKMSLGDFLTDETLGSWADEMEDMPVGGGGAGRTGYGGQRNYGDAQGGYGSGGFNDRGYSMREALPLPDKPPYTVHVGNLSFDVTESEITDYFTGCSVTNVRIVEDKLEMKPKGFGYVEFASLDGLKKALDFNGTQFGGRNIRVSVAEPPKDRPDAREFGDWTRKGPLPDLPGGQRRTPDRGFAPRTMENSSDAGSERGDRRRPQFEQNDNKVRDFGNWERRGPLSPVTATGPSHEGSSGAGASRGGSGGPDGFRDRRQSPAWGEGSSNRGQSGPEGRQPPPRRDVHDRPPPPPERQATAAETDTQWRSKMRADAPAKSPTPLREGSNPPSPAVSHASLAPAMRPKLHLQKRTVSEAETSSPASASSTDPKASPFGAARPIDTHAKELEIEEKRQLALRQKKEAEEKAREERRVAKEAEEKAREEKRVAKEAAKAAQASQEKENGQAAVSPANKEPDTQVQQSKFISRDVRNELPGPDTATTQEAKVDGQNGKTVDEKANKPKQSNARDGPPSKGAGAWRDSNERKEVAATATAASTEVPAESPTAPVEDDGWSTVSKAKNNRRGGGNHNARAVAS